MRRRKFSNPKHYTNGVSLATCLSASIDYNQMQVVEHIE